MNKTTLIIFFSIFALSLVSSAPINDNLHLNIQAINSTGDVVTGTFLFTFNISTTNDCANVVYSNFSTLTTDSRGIISYYLENTNLNYSDQYWLCYYRNNSLINVTKISYTPYTFYANNSANWQGMGNFNATQMSNSNGILNILESWLKSLFYTKAEVDANLTLVNTTLSEQINSLNTSLGNYASNTTAGIQNLINSTGIYSIPLTINTTANIQTLINGTNMKFGNVDFNSGWQNGGVSIIGSDVWAKTLYVANITSVSINNLNVNGSLLPGFDNFFDIGSSSLRWKNIYSSGDIKINGTLYYGNAGIPLTALNDTNYVNGLINSVNTTLNIQNLYNLTSSIIANTSFNQNILTYNNSIYNDAVWNQSGTNVFLNNPTGNVGIGTSNPSQTLNVVGIANITSSLFFEGNKNLSQILNSINTTLNIQNLLNSTGIYSTPLTINTTLNIQNLLAGTNISQYAFNQTIGSNAYTNLQVGLVNTTLNIQNLYNSTLYQGLGIINTTLNIQNLYNYTASIIANTSFNQNILTYNNTVYNNAVWNQSGTNAFLNNPTDNVGIGTTNPSQKLDVAGNINVNGQITSNGSSASLGTNDRDNSSIAYQLYSHSGVARIWSNIQGDIISFNGSTKNVGIGTSNPAVKLQVLNPATGDGLPATSGTAQPNANIRIGNVNTNAVLDMGVASGIGTWIQGTTQTDLSAESILLLNPNGGNVGIGTTSPGTTLDILGLQGTINSAIRQPGIINLYDTNTTFAQDVGAALTLGGIYNSGGAKSDFAAIKGGKDSSTDSVAPGYLALYTTPITGVLTERMRIDSSGNVGIGTSSPDNKLDVAGLIQFSPTILGTTNYGAYSYNDVFQLNPRTATGTYANVTGLVMNSIGNVGIGTTSPATDLEVNGNENLSGQLGLGGLIPTTGTGRNSTQLLLNSRQGTTENSALRAIYQGNDVILGEASLLANRRGAWDGLYINGTGTALTNSLYIEGNKPVIFNGMDMAIQTTTGNTQGLVIGNHSTVVSQNAGQEGLQLSYNSLTNNLTFLNAQWGTSYQPFVFKGKTFDFQTGTSAVAQRFYIDSLGNVGIGTTSPSTKLEIQGNSSAVAGNFYQTAFIHSTSAGLPGLRFGVDSGTSGGIIAPTENSGGAPLEFWIYNHEFPLHYQNQFYNYYYQTIKINLENLY